MGDDLEGLISLAQARSRQLDEVGKLNELVGSLALVLVERSRLVVSIEAVHVVHGCGGWVERVEIVRVLKLVGDWSKVWIGVDGGVGIQGWNHDGVD